MNKRLVLRHLTGTKASTTEEFPLDDFNELIFGRDSSCDIRYDPDRDDLVSRRHIKVVLTDRALPEFMIVDLRSRNGTFVNKQRVSGSEKLSPGDVVQLGAGGPEFIVDIEPHVAQLAPTVSIPLPYMGAVAGQTRSGSEDGGEGQNADPAPVVKTRRPPPKRRSIKLGVAVLSFILLALPLFFVKRPTSFSRQAQTTLQATVERGRAVWERTRNAIYETVTRGSELIKQPVQSIASGSETSLTMSDIEKANADSVVSIEGSWTLLDQETGRSLQQVYMQNEMPGQSATNPPLVPGAGRELPVFVLTDHNRLQPMLTIGQSKGFKPVGGKRHGTGFVVTSDGIILTNRSVAAPWTTAYEWEPQDVAGIVAVLDQQRGISQTAVISRQQFPEWVPTNAGFVLDDSFTRGSLRLTTRRIRATGRTDQLSVTFTNRDAPVPARLIRSSGTAELAAIKIDTPMSVRKVSLRDNSDCKAGDSVLLLKFRNPAEGDHNKSAKPSIRVGKVTKLWRAQDDRPNLKKSTSDEYELDFGAQDMESFGAPVLDDRGRVVAVQTRPDPMYPAGVFALPIRYAMELIDRATT
jgi:serine protease Do